MFLLSRSPSFQKRIGNLQAHLVIKELGNCGSWSHKRKLNRLKINDLSCIHQKIEVSAQIRALNPGGRRIQGVTAETCLSGKEDTWVRARLLQLCPALCDPRDCVVRQAPLSMGFSRQEYRSGLPCPSPGDLPDSGITASSLLSSALAGGFFTTGITWGSLVKRIRVP